VVLKEVGFFRRHLVAAATLVAIALVASAAWVYTGLYDIAADQPHWGVTSKFINTLRDRSINTRSEKITPPDNLSDAGLVKKGAAQFAAMCSGCHTGPGEQPSDLNEGLYPTPPDFTKVKTEPARAFWIIKHGVKMSGMPA
jgi:mono/diheme cytochrome c family protein